MPVKKRFFDDLMSDRKLSLRSVAKTMEMLPSQLSLTLNGKRRMQIAEAVKLSHILGASVSEVMVAAGIDDAKSTRRRCTVVRYVDGFGFAKPTENGVERVQMPDALPDSTVAIQMRTADSPLSYADGWIMFCSSERHDPNELLNCMSWVKLEGGEETMGTLRRGYERGTFNLTRGFNNLTNQRLEWASKVFMITL